MCSYERWGLAAPGGLDGACPLCPWWPAPFPGPRPPSPVLHSLPPRTRAHMVTPESQSSCKKDEVRQTTSHYIDQSLYACLMCEDPEKSSLTVRGGLLPHLHTRRTVSGRPSVLELLQISTQKDKAPRWLPDLNFRSHSCQAFQPET